MSHPIPEATQRLVTRLRLLADELESAARYGVPIPTCVSADGFEHGDAAFALDPAAFDAWVDYTEAPIDRDYVSDDKRWRVVEIKVNDLPLRFSTSEPLAAEVTA